MNPESVKDVVKEKYGQAAVRARAGAGNSCCGGAGASDSCADPITSNLYDARQEGEVPDLALKASLGCGNPTALAELKAGETVLDLGSGGGIDVLLSARRVGPSGRAFGLDMTDEMLSVAEENKRKSGLENVTFLKGEIENIPLPDNSIDVIISNCVINLSGDKDRVLREAFRVLKPGGSLVFQIPSHPAWTIKGMMWRCLPLWLCGVLLRLKTRQAVNMEMHGIARRDVLDLLREQGTKVMGCRLNSEAGSDWVSYLYLVTK